MKKIRCKRKCWLYVALIVVLGTAFLFWKRWDAWFKNEPEQAYTTPDSITRVTLTAGENFLSERNISWRCGERLQTAFLEYIETPLLYADTLVHWRRVKAEGALVQTRNGKGCYYTARLAGLKPGTNYRYRLYTGSHLSDEYEFEMVAGNDTLSKFVYIGDVQDPEVEQSKQRFLHFLTMDTTSQKPDFVAMGGDAIHAPTDECWNAWFDAWDSRYIATKPFLMATGNHEYYKKGFSRLLDSRWVAQYANPYNGPSDFAGRSYYVDFPLMRFIVLDSNDINDISSILNHRSWLTKVLRESSQPWQVVMMHHAVRCVREGRSNLVMRYAFKSVLEDEGADLVLQGHDHAYSRLSAKADGKPVTPVYLISNTSPKVYRNGFDDYHDRLGSGIQLYQTVEVRPKELRMRSYLFDGALYDDVLIRHSGKKGEQNAVEDLAKNIPELLLYNDFGNDKKGRKRAEKYREDVTEWLSRKR